jgi:hypothetical protein
MGQVDSTCAAPPRRRPQRHKVLEQHPSVAAQVDPFETQTLKPVFHFIGFKG